MTENNKCVMCQKMFNNCDVDLQFDNSTVCHECKYKTSKIEISLFGGYNGRIECNVSINGVRHILEKEDIIELIQDNIDSKGYKIEKTSRQKYPRIVINTVKAIKYHSNHDPYCNIQKGGVCNCIPAKSLPLKN